MHIVSKPILITDADVEARFDELASHNTGKGVLDITEVFIASTGLRLLINSLPELVNLIESYAFAWATGVIESTSATLGRSLFTDTRIDDDIETDVKYMMQGKLRTMYYRLRDRMLRLDGDDQQRDKTQLRYLSKSLDNALNMRLIDSDPLVNDMCTQGMFGVRNDIVRSCIELAITEEMGEFITKHCPRDDRERYLDYLRLGLQC
jgi:hypothetical protein